MPSENEFVAELVRGLPPDLRLEVPVGDDAAVLRPPALRQSTRLQTAMYVSVPNDGDAKSERRLATLLGRWTDHKVGWAAFL